MRGSRGWEQISRRVVGCWWRTTVGDQQIAHDGNVTLDQFSRSLHRRLSLVTSYIKILVGPVSRSSQGGRERTALEHRPDPRDSAGDLSGRGFPSLFLSLSLSF
ncbi:hypothetical protein CDEST_02855 [Colletotrichum destructivum]|uniref:Uncharacterized protein n=1 Tax=Colletotrichum destructivum TaxID=34406 RepID=A0AAX4I347_9PEZI|nr:hypothetical protein CDEST_02855 [Colletotrichum destructivum]